MLDGLHLGAGRGGAGGGVGPEGGAEIGLDWAGPELRGGGGGRIEKAGLGYQVGGLVRTGVPRAFLETGLFVGWSLAEQNSTCGPHEGLPGPRPCCTLDS